ncbi:MAG TPA: DUF362 domain-containing protein [bacterium]|nr:DUF362 domain-containing protein [bacterium]HQO34775.1 DUF362 domain-containing protein [bacterium]HQP98587.1 DUF362 domain-containing protein [bacterium]
MPPLVHFIPVHPQDLESTIEEKIGALFEAAGLIDIIQSKDLVGLKVHFGEEGNETFIRPSRLCRMIEQLNKAGAKPFFTDTNTLYVGMRSNSIDHVRLALKHGFGLVEMGIPILIADGLAGGDEVEVEINGRHLQRVGVASGIAAADALIVITHVTGHCAAGLGGVLKNLGMGCTSRKGKLHQHAALKPHINLKKCVGDFRCIPNCPSNAIIQRNKKAEIQEEICIGCGECLVVCRYGAATFSWDNSGPSLQERMVEHALGVSKVKKDKIAYLSFLTGITQECDCFPNKEKDVIVPAVGVVASRDPVALEQAGVDLIEKTTGRSFRELFHCHDFSRLLDYAEEVGLGSRAYELVTVNG